LLQLVSQKQWILETGFKFKTINETFKNVLITSLLSDFPSLLTTMAITTIVVCITYPLKYALEATGGR
jgi:hypothetical protein